MVADVYKQYQERLVQSNAVDFDDLILVSLQLLKQDEGERYDGCVSSSGHLSIFRCTFPPTVYLSEFTLSYLYRYALFTFSIVSESSTMLGARL